METEFKCKTKTPDCIPRSSVNNGISDCNDGSDEKISNLVCYDFEFICSFYDNSTTSVYKRCLTYNMIRDGKSDCFSSLDDKILVEICTHERLFLCLDQSRCLPERLRSNGVVNCIDGSDEIEGCAHPAIFRHFEDNKAFLHH